MLLVIEGDNGSGKTTISELLQKNGLHIVTNDTDVKELELTAKNLPAYSIERIESFLEYNEYCGKKAKEYKKSVLIRYWISTMAAAYADCILDKEKILEKVMKLVSRFEIPDIFIYLQCDYSERIDRIEKRKTEEGDLGDDISIGRSTRYQEIISILSKIIPNWKTINVSKKTPDQVKADIDEILKSLQEN